MPTEPTARRPLKTREWPIFKNLAAWLTRVGISPNTISFASAGFGCAAGLAFAATDHMVGWEQRGFWLLAAAFIQLRLIANLLDGMVAVEGRQGGPTGELWNEAPDRVSDAAIFIGAGYAAGSEPIFGWAAALVAVFVAYVRALGASAGVGQIFLGPMAKPQRMALMTFACVLLFIFPVTSPTSLSHLLVDFHVHGAAFVLRSLDSNSIILPVALGLIIIGSLVTAGRRLARIARLLREKGARAL